MLLLQGVVTDAGLGYCGCLGDTGLGHCCGRGGGKMNAPRMVWEMNVNTWVSIAGFLIVIGGGYATYSATEARNEMRHQDAERRIEVLEVGRQANADAIRAMQIASATSASEITALRRDINALNEQLHEVAVLLREVSEGKK